MGINTPENQTAAIIHTREVLQPLEEASFHDKEGLYAAQVAVPLWMFAKDGDAVSRLGIWSNAVTKERIVALLSRIRSRACSGSSAKEPRYGW